PPEELQSSGSSRTHSLPFTFRGPMGRYAIELLEGDRVKSRMEVTIDPSDSKQLVLGEARKHRSAVLPILGGLAAGGVAVALLGGSKPKPTTGGISIQLP